MPGRGHFISVECEYEFRDEERWGGNCTNNNKNKLGVECKVSGRILAPAHQRVPDSALDLLPSFLLP